MITAEQLAQKFHETYEQLAIAHEYETRKESRKPWAEVPEKNRKLMIAVCRIILHETVGMTDQSLAHDRNLWQRRLGALVTLIEHFAARAGKDGVAPSDCAALLESAYNVVNTNPFTGNIDDPHADVARLTVQRTLEAAIAGGLVVPGPNWMQPEAVDGEEEAAPE